MATLSELQAQRDEILKAMSLPKSQQFGERSVTFRDAADLEKALLRIDREIAAAQSANASGVFVVSTGRGLE